MTLAEAHESLEEAIVDLEVSPLRGRFTELVASARELLETTTTPPPDDERTEAECVADLQALAAAVSIWKEGVIRAHQRMQA